jgi:hypothetical protein
LDHASEELSKKEVMRHMKLFKPTSILLVLLLAAMVMVPMVSAAPDKISPDIIKQDVNFISVEKATSVANIYVKQFSSSFTDYADWNGATVKKVTTYYDMNGKESAYSFDVLVNGQYAGYLMISATRDNYPVLEFSKGKTPDREVTVQNIAKTLASTDAKTRQETLGDGRPLYLGATFYYMQYPVEKTGNLKSSQQTSDNTILVDLNENKVVDQKNIVSADTWMIASRDLASVGFDEKNVTRNQVQKKQDANTEWKAFDNLDSARTQQGIIASSNSRDGPVDFYNIDTVPNVNDYPALTGGCAPTSIGMIFSYYKNEFGCSRFPQGGNLVQVGPLETELHSAMHTNENGDTYFFNMAYGANEISSKYGFDLHTIFLPYYYPAQKLAIRSNMPYTLFMIGSRDEYQGTAYGNHVVTATGFREISGGEKFIIVNDAYGHSGVNLHNKNWNWAAVHYVIPTKYTVTTTAGPNGNIDQPSQPVIGGADSKLITTTATSGYVIESLTVSDGTTVSEAVGEQSYPYTVSNVRQDLVVTATFKPSATNENQLLTHGFIEELSGAGKVVTLNTTAFYWDGTGHVYLTGGNGYMNTAADDVFDVDTDTGSLTFAGPYLQIYQGIPDITPICHVGENTLTLKVRDLYSVRFGCPETWLYFDHGLDKTAVPVTISPSDLASYEEFIMNNTKNTTEMNTV